MNIVLKIVLSFFLVFNFPIPIIYNSATLALVIILFIYLFKHDKLLPIVVNLFSNKDNVCLFTLLLSLFPVTGLFALLHQTNDFTLLKALLLQLILITSAMMVFPILTFNKSNQHLSIIKLLITLFILQSIIEMLAFSFPSVAELVKFFQKEEVGVRGGVGLRALALTGNPYFDLASGFGFIFIVLIRYIDVSGDKGFKFKYIIILLVFIIGSLFAGRSAFIGLGFAMGYYFLLWGKTLKTKILGFLKLVVLSIIIGILVFVFLPANIKDLVVNRLLPFAFEFAYNYYYFGEATTASTMELQQMYFPISIKTFFIGDGRYAGINTDYYMGTDAGYMRNVLFFGIGGFFLILLYQLSFFKKPLQLIISGIKIRGLRSDYNSLLFFVLILLLMLLLHYKGEVLAYLHILQIMLLWLSLSFSQTYTNNEKNSITYS